MTSKKRKAVAFECAGATEESSTKRKVAAIECGGATEESSAESGAPLEPPAYVYGSLQQFQKRQKRGTRVFEQKGRTCRDSNSYGFIME